jgi:hypothetical protein
MVHRFVVRSEVTSPAAPRLVNNVISTDRWSAMTTVALFAGAALLSLQAAWDDGPFGLNKLMTCLAVAGFVVACALCIGNVDQSSASHECVVSIYPIGIQIECLVRSSPSGKADKVQRTPLGKPVFVPREAVIDCIVIELVHSHKVASKVLFRIGEWPKFCLSDPYVHLVEAFPGVEMTYAECLAMRAEINRYLLQDEVR